MSRFRFSIGSCLAAVTLLGLGLAALVSQSTLDASVAYTTFLVLLALATTLAIVPGSRERLFCAGFAVFGWCYWFTEFEIPAASVPQQLWTTGISTGLPRPQTPDDRRGPGLLTRPLITFVESKLFPNRQVGAQVMAQLTSSGYFPGTIVATKNGQFEVQWVDGSRQWTPANLIWSDPAATRLSCHSLLGGLFALFGAVLATWLAGRSSPALSPAAPSVQTPPAPETQSAESPPTSKKRRTWRTAIEPLTVRGRSFSDEIAARLTSSLGSRAASDRQGIPKLRRCLALRHGPPLPLADWPSCLACFGLGIASTSAPTRFTWNCPPWASPER